MTTTATPRPGRFIGPRVNFLTPCPVCGSDDVGFAPAGKTTQADCFRCMDATAVGIPTAAYSTAAIPEVAAPTGNGAGHGTTTNGPSEAQVAYADKLIAERYDDPKAAELKARFRTLSRKGASDGIDRLLAIPKKATPAPAPAAPVTTPTVDLSNVPAGFYAVPGGDTRLKVRIDRPTEGKWNGYIFVKDGAEYGNGKRYGTVRPGDAGAYRGDIPAAMAIIAADPAAASAAYGHLVGRCGVCNRHLEDAKSVERGIGPVCAAKYGW